MNSRSSTTADDILLCGRSLIITGGYNGFSYADIAKVVGIRKASIHHHFPAKADLVRTLVARYRAEADAGLAYMSETTADPLERLQRYIAYWEDCIGNTTAPICVCALLAAQLPALPDDVAAEVRAHFKTLSSWLTGVLAEGAAAGRLRLAEAPEIEAETFLATVHGAMVSARAYGMPELFGTITRPLLHRLA